MLANVAFSAMLPLCCAYAALRGGAPERLVAISFVIAAIATAATGYGVPTNGQTRWGVFAVDVALLTALVAIAFRANRLWTLPTCSLQLVTAIAHFANTILPGNTAWAYAASIMVTSLLMPPLLAYGTYCHQRRLRRTGADRSWRILSPPSPATTRTI